MVDNCRPRNTVKTRILIVSDTHSHWPSLIPAREAPGFRDPLPKCDVFIHAGDMTNVGQYGELEKVVDWISKIDAQVKIVIAGNHDLNLDEQLRPHRKARIQGGPDESSHAAISLFTSPAAVARGIIYLPDETRTITLTSGATFTVHGSPWQPKFCGWAFNYPHHIDRWNPATSPRTAIPENVDILITHGPPHGVLDVARRPNDHVGCPWLKLALERVRPRLHVFGHIHEGRGVARLKWHDRRDMEHQAAIAAVESGLQSAAVLQSGNTDESWFDFAAREVMQTAKIEKRFSILLDADMDSYLDCTLVDVSESGNAGNVGGPLQYKEETLAVNGSLLSVRGRLANAPIIVDLDLPMAGESF